MRLRKTLFSVLVAVVIVGVAEGASRLVLLALGDRPTSGIRFEQPDVWDHGENPFIQEDADLLWRMIPGYAEGSLRINDHGFRGPEIAIPKPPGTFRVVLLGDSVTFGFNVREEDTYASRLRGYLNAAANRYPAEGYTTTEVVNAGVMGYSSWQGRSLYAQALPRLEPDLVICSFGYNDHHSAVESDREKSSGAAMAIVRASGVFRLAQRVGGHGASQLESQPVPRVDLEGFRENVLGIKHAVNRDGARAIFLTVPIRLGVPLVENFRAVSRGSDRVWLRQLDFAVEELDPRWRKAVTDHFTRGTGIRSFASDASNRERVLALSREHAELPVFHYLLACCEREAGHGPGAVAAMEQSRRLDQERREMEAYNEALRALARASQVDVIDVARRMEQDGASSGLFHDVVHPTPLGHDRMARIVAEYLHTHP